jgi:uroporphyrinogen decarboxylase
MVIPMHRLIQALHCKNKGRPPVWLMRQAGRYMPQYRKLKQGKTLFGMFHDPEMIVDVTLLPIDLLGVDAAILFSDILTVLDGLNIRYDFQDQIGPVVLDPPTSLQMIEPKMAYAHIIKAIQELKKILPVPLLGFAGAPFTIASYMIEGKTSKDLRKTKQWLFREPSSFMCLLNQITEATIAYLHCQIDAGVDAIQLFDSWANAVGFEEFKQICLPPMRSIVDSVKKRGIPVILFTRGSCLFADALASLEPSAISLDWSGNLAQIAPKIPSHIAIQGNLDPMALYGSKELIRSKIDALLSTMKGHPGYIFNLGHGILPDTPFENVQFLVDYVRSESFVEVQ